VAVSDDVLVRLRAIGAAAFKGAMEGAATSIGHVDTKAKHADKSTDAMSKNMGKGGGRLKSTVGTLAKWAGGAAAVAGAARGLHSAIASTEELAKGTMRLSRTTGMDSETASAWAEVVKTRGVNASQFQRGLVALSKQMHVANGGNEKAVTSFKNLGVAMDDVNSGNTQAVIMQLSDSFKTMKNPADRAAIAQKLFGRQSQDLLPLLSSGSTAIQEQLDTAKKYGAVIGNDGVNHTKEFAQKMREMQMASDGLKVSVGEALIPAMLSMAQALGQIVNVMQPILRNGPLMTVIIGTLATAFIALKVAQLQAAIAALSFNAAFLLIPIALVALVAGLIYAYKHVAFFRHAVDAAVTWIKNALVNAFNWIKTHWVLLASILGGPFVAAAIQIAKHWGQIKSSTSSAVRWVIDKVKSLPHAFWEAGRGIVRSIVDGIKSAPHAVLDAIKGLVPGKLQSAGAKLGLWAHGGVVPHTQWGIVGERGPELLQLPGGTRITPLPAHAAASASAPVIAQSASASGSSQTTAHFYLDRRLIASAVAQDTSDQRARR
jgi:hypothetical protein